MAPIVYDTTPSPSPDELRAWADELGLPPRSWTVVRRLMGRVVATGSRADGEVDLVMRAGRGERHATRFAKALANARTLARVVDATDSRWLAAPDPASWTLGEHDGVSLLAAPYVAGTPLAPERRLSGAERSALVAEIPTVIRIVRALGLFSPLIPPAAFDRDAYVGRCVARVDERLADLVATDGLDAGIARGIRVDFERRISAAPLEPAFCHGELTAWHIIRRADGRLSLIDLETMGARDPRHIDDSVFVMRTWGLNGAPEVARAFLITRRVAEPADRRADYDAETDWQWPYAAVRTRAESRVWSDRRGAMSFWDWATRAREARAAA